MTLRLLLLAMVGSAVTLWIMGRALVALACLLQHRTRQETRLRAYALGEPSEDAPYTKGGDYVDPLAQARLDLTADLRRQAETRLRTAARGRLADSGAVPDLRDRGAGLAGGGDDATGPAPGRSGSLHAVPRPVGAAPRETDAAAYLRLLRKERSR